MNKLKNLHNGSTMVFITAFAVFVALALLSNVWEWCQYLLFGYCILIALIATTMVIFAWVINPIRRIKNKKINEKD